jgi:hypothetical protein
MAQSIFNSNCRSFWNEVLKLNHKFHATPNTIDCVLGNEDISQVFANKYQSLYNSVSYDNDAMCKLMLKLNDLIENECGVTVQHHVSYDAMSRVNLVQKMGMD